MRSISLLDKIAIFLCTGNFHTRPFEIGDPLINATGEHVTGILCGPIAQWSEYSHGLRGVLGSSPGRIMCFFLPCDLWWLSVGPCSGCEQQRDCLVGSGLAPSSLGDESIQAGGTCHRPTVWPYSSVVRVLARSARGPGFESRSGHVLIPPLLQTCMTFLLQKYIQICQIQVF